MSFSQRACLYLQSILCFLTSYHASFFYTAFLTILWLPLWKLSSLRLRTWLVLLPLCHLHLAHVWHTGTKVNAWVNQFLNFIHKATELGQGEISVIWIMSWIQIEVQKVWLLNLVISLRFLIECIIWVGRFKTIISKWWTWCETLSIFLWIPLFLVVRLETRDW